MRPNQWLAVTLGAVANTKRIQQMLQTTQCLLVPGAARSLAPLPVTRPAQSWPYAARYSGAEDQQRKPAYHNGTAWCWLYPSYAEGLLKGYGAAALPTARMLMSASASLLNEGCVGQLPEILDGDLPHAPRGCGAQAWSVSEWLRVWRLLV
jgi:starch synthase (maltosyl-transferring)